MLKKTELFSYIIWTQAFIGMLMSLYFSEIMGLPPCTLCWYQRIALYPIVFIATVGIIRKDLNYVWYALPLAIVGFIVAIFHNLLYAGFIPELNFTCSAGISCTTQQIQWFGFVTIPLLSLVAYSIIIVCLYCVIKYRSHEQRS